MTPPSTWPRRWRSRWIWWSKRRALNPFGLAESIEPQDAIGYLRKSFVLDLKPASARARITADGRYILWVNGHRVGAGPIRSEPAFLHYDEYELGPHLLAGENILAVTARHYGEAVTTWKPAKRVGELGFGAITAEAEIGETLYATDDSWRARPAPYLPADSRASLGLPATEILDGSQVPHGWLEPGFDDSDWPVAVTVDPIGVSILRPEPPSEPFPLLSARPLPPLSERIVVPDRITGRGTAEQTDSPNLVEAFESDSGSRVDVASESVLLEAGQSATFDFSEIVFAHPILSVEAAAGTHLDLAAGEDLEDDGRPVIKPASWTSRYIAAGVSGEDMESFEPVGFRYLQVAARSGSARISVSARERTYPRPSGPYFRCSDAGLERLWEAGVRSLDLCSSDAYMDCPGREQRAWLGDAYVHTLVSLVSNPDYRLAKWNLQLHAQGARADGLLPMVAAADLTDTWLTIPDYSLHWIRTLTRTYEYTGDTGLVEQLIPVAGRVMEWFERHRGADGLLNEVQNWVFIDWAQTERLAHIAALDALYVLALDDLAMLAGAVDDAGTARRARARADQTREAFEHYWDPVRGVYVDSAKRVSQQTNALAILSGCAPADRWPSILDYTLDESRLVLTKGPSDPGPVSERLKRQWLEPEGFDVGSNVVMAQPFFSHFVHQAVVAAGRKELIFDLVRRWLPMLEKGNGCFEEYWDAEPGQGSRCHAWSATPSYDLSTHVLGVRPVSPGFDDVVIEPHLGEIGGDLDAVEGAVPTPKGLVRVVANRDGTEIVELPEGVSRAQASRAK